MVGWAGRSVSTVSVSPKGPMEAGRTVTEMTWEAAGAVESISMA